MNKKLNYKEYTTSTKKYQQYKNIKVIMNY